MQDLIMDLTNHFDTQEEDNECIESDDDIDENCSNEFLKAEHLCELLVEKEKYVLNIAATSASTNAHIAVGLSSGDTEVFKLNDNFIKYTTLQQNADKIIGLKFQNDNDHLLWTGSHKGIISLWDLRIPEQGAVSNFEDTTDDKIDKDRKFNSFDISLNGRLLCAGTDTFEGDSFLLFWDVRKCKLAGGFWESHTDDITQVQFHPRDSNKISSGSTDGLINIYDLTQTCEDDALIDTMNTESSIEKLKWAELESWDVIGCVTHTADVQLWKNEEVHPYVNLSRGKLAQNLKRSSENYIYVVDVHFTNNCSVILAGSNVKNGQCVRGIKVDKSSIKPAFGLMDNKQRIRCSWLNDKAQLLLTGGEGGYLSAWKLGKESMHM